MLGAALVLLAFLAGAGLRGAARPRGQRAAPRTSRGCRAPSTCCWPAPNSTPTARWSCRRAFPEPRLSLPGSGLYASIFNVARARSVAARRRRSGSQPAVPARRGGRPVALRARSTRRAAATWPSATACSWEAGQRAVRAAGAVGAGGQGRVRPRGRASSSARCGPGWAAPALLLLLSQTLLLRMGPGAAAAGRARDPPASSTASRPTSRAAIRPRSPALTGNLNTLIQQERVRQTRYREALSFLAHSLKTPLAVLRTALADPAAAAGGRDASRSRAWTTSCSTSSAAAAASGAAALRALPGARRRCRNACAIRWPRCMPTRTSPSTSTARRSCAGASTRAMPSRCSAT